MVLMQTNAMALEIESLDGVSISGSTKSRRRFSTHSQFRHLLFAHNIVHMWPGIQGNSDILLLLGYLRYVKGFPNCCYPISTLRL